MIDIVLRIWLNSDAFEWGTPYSGSEVRSAHEHQEGSDPKGATTYTEILNTRRTAGLYCFVMPHPMLSCITSRYLHGKL